MMRVLVLGASGMLGSAMLEVLGQSGRYEVWGTQRRPAKLMWLSEDQQSRIIAGIDVLDSDTLVGLLSKLQPDVVVNCVGLVKQLSDSKDPLVALPINSMFPHRLARLCELAGTRVIHISTDCVFSGQKGGYVEGDQSDAEDLYGKSKFIGELVDYDHAVTLRTSIIGHEYGSDRSLVDWFLKQEGVVKGFSRAVFSGLPTVELARVVGEFVLPNRDLRGLYHVAADPIAKLELLRLIANRYRKSVEIVPDDHLVIDRSLSGEKFCNATGYQAPEWAQLVSDMYRSYELRNA